jgi:hypothetical protein
VRVNNIFTIFQVFLLFATMHLIPPSSILSIACFTKCVMFPNLALISRHDSII